MSAAAGFRNRAAAGRKTHKEDPVPNKEKEVVMKTLAALLSTALLLTAAVPLTLDAADRMVVGEMFTNTG